MLLGLLVWSGIHLLANGDRTGTVIFGSFFVYAVIALISAVERHSARAFVATWKHDAIAISSGLALAYLTMRYHPLIFGTAPVA